MSDTGQQLLSEGRRLYGIALWRALTGDSGDSANKDIRRAIVALSSAMNWLEGWDSDGFDLAHQFLDKSGELARREFSAGCCFDFRDDAYHQACPVALAHSRVGMSAGFVIKQSHCSVCGKDPEECEHISGRVYDGERCCRVITEAELLEVSLVERPNQPDARIHSYTLTRSELYASLGEGFAWGMTISCDRCLNPCRGLSYPMRNT